MALVAITRDVSASLGDCALSFMERGAIDVERAVVQHDGYRRALESLGCRVLALPAQDGFPDAVFVEDVALVLGEVAVITRPGAESRRGETDSVARALGDYRVLLRIAAPGTLDGGDVLRVGRDIYVGRSARSNAEGITQLRALLAGHGYRVHGVPTRDCLHLKSAATLVADGTLLVQPAWVDPALFPGHRQIQVDPGEAHAANALRIGGGVVYPDCFPRTRQRLEDAGVTVVAVDVSELQKAEGAVTCCSLVFETGPAMA